MPHIPGFCVFPSRRLVYNATASTACDDAGMHDGVAEVLRNRAAASREEAVSYQRSALGKRCEDDVSDRSSPGTAFDFIFS